MRSRAKLRKLLQAADFAIREREGNLPASRQWAWQNWRRIPENDEALRLQMVYNVRGARYSQLAQTLGGRSTVQDALDVEELTEKILAEHRPAAARRPGCSGASP